MPRTFEDIREFIKFLEDRNELVRVAREVDPILEINAILDKLARTRGPAILFEKVKGSEMPLFGNAFGTLNRIGWALGDDDFQALVDQRMAGVFDIVSGKKETPGYVPEQVEKTDAPCKEIILTGDEIDLNKFPLIKLWPRDGGKYITLPLIVTRDPETGHLNVGIYRMMMLDKNRLCMHWLPVKHGALHYEKAEKLDRELPVAVVVGADPALAFAGMLALPGMLDEFQMAGYLKGRSIKITAAEDSDLPVPAGAEIVFEGVVKPGERADEGPFGEFHGYYSPVKQTPVFHVRKITMRKNPVWHAATTGMPPTEIHAMGKGVERISAGMARKFMPGIVDIALPSAAGALYFMIISINKTKPHEAKKLIKLMWDAGGQNSYVTNIIVVDGDVDVHNLQNVFWAVSVHFRPEYDVMVSEVGVADPEKPSTFPRGLGAKMGIDATTKMDAEGLKRPMPDLVKMDPEIIEKVDRHWVSDGFK